MKKLDMLFFLGIFALVFGVILVVVWLAKGDVRNLYGTFLLVLGGVLVAARPKPPAGFFFGHMKEEAAEKQKVQCWCGRFMKAGTKCDHGTGTPKDF